MLPPNSAKWFRLALRPPNRRRVFLHRGRSRWREPSAAQLATSARFGVATRDRGKVWARMVRACKAKVVNENLPTRYCGLTRCTKAASQAAFKNRSEKFFSFVTANRSPRLGMVCGLLFRSPGYAVEDLF